MLTATPATWTVRGTTFVLWGLAGASVVYWALKLGGTQLPVNVPVRGPQQVGTADPVAIARLLGSTPGAATGPAAVPVASLASRFQLVGVVAGERSGAGAAVIAVDGKPAKPYRVGAALDEGLLLQSVRGRTAVIASQPAGPALVTLELPALSAPVQRAAIAAPR